MAKKNLPVAIVTGASGNMGQAMIKKFLTEGFRVIGTVVPNDPVKIKTTHLLFETAVVNLTDAEDAEKFVSGVITKYKKVDVAVLTVGGFAMGSIAETSAADIEKQYKLNFETAYNIVRPVFTEMTSQQQGRLFLIGSRPGLSSSAAKGMVAYSLAKSLIFRLADLLNDEAKGTNVVTSVIVPSTIDTPQNRSSMADADFSAWVKPAAIADAVYFYCTKEAAVLREPIIKVYNKA